MPTVGEGAAGLRRVFQQLVSFAVVGSWTLGASLAATPPRSGSKDLDNASLQERLPLRIYGGFLVVAEGQFGGALQHQNFILDTGTSPSMLNLRVAKQLGLNLSPGRVEAIGQDSKIEVAILPELQLGSLQVKSTPVLVTDLMPVERNWNVPIAGILGLDILGQTSFRIDYEHRVLEFGAVSGEGIAVGLSTRLGLPITEVKLNGHVLRLLVDTGSDHLVFFGKHSGADIPFNAGAPLSGKGIAGTVPVRAVPSLEFEWNGEHFQKNAVIVSDREDSMFDGLLSVRSMGFRSIALDANSHVVYLQK